MRDLLQIPDGYEFPAHFIGTPEDKLIHWLRERVEKLESSRERWAITSTDEKGKADAHKKRLRDVCQTLVEIAGADGPCNAEDAAKRVKAHVEKLTRTIRKQDRTAVDRVEEIASLEARDAKSNEVVGHMATLVARERNAYGIDLTRNAGWFLHVVGWRQLVLLLAVIFASYWLAVYLLGAEVVIP